MLSLAVKYRPKEFNECVGQTSTIRILNKQIEHKDYRHSYIFSGASGCGKTTLARIFANKINEGIGNPIEIDGASNNGVDNVRMICDSAKERAIDSKYKIFIVDEAHMITTQGWNAFLKSIEEPPTFTIFIFCTTELNKIPQTIQNRCQKFNFTRMTSDQIVSRLEFICRSENFENYKDSVDYISKVSNGGMRDAIANLEKVADFDSHFSLEATVNILGSVSYDAMFALANAIKNKLEPNVVGIVEQAYLEGIDIKTFINEFNKFILELNKYVLFNSFDMVSIPKLYHDKVEEIKDVSINMLNEFLELRSLLKSDFNTKDIFEMWLLGLVRR